MISAVNCRPLNGFLLSCFTASSSQPLTVVAEAEQCSKLQQNLSPVLPISQVLMAACDPLFRKASTSARFITVPQAPSPNELHLGPALDTRLLHGGFEVLRSRKCFSPLPVGHFEENDDILWVVSRA